MPAKGNVSLTRQTIYCFIPIMNWYAAYNIRKFRRYLLIVIIVELSLGAIYAGLIPEYDENGINKGEISKDIDDLEINWTEIIFRTDHPSGLPIFLLIVIVEYSVTVFLIRRWTNQWNTQFN
jgi:hypothetical protein